MMPTSDIAYSGVSYNAPLEQLVRGLSVDFQCANAVK